MCTCCTTAVWSAGALALCAVAVGVSVTACMVRPQVEASHAAPEPPAATAETAAPTPTPAPTETPAAMPAATLPTLSDAANSPRFACPVQYKYISRFMSVDGGHRGDDLHAAEGTDIYAAADALCWLRRSITAGAILWRSTTVPTPTACAGSRCTPT